MNENDIFKEVEKLIDIGIALSAESDLYRLLNLIVKEARQLTKADGGSIYLVDGKWLKFIVSQSDMLSSIMGQEKMAALFTGHMVPISKKNLAGYVAVTGTAVNVADAYNLPQDAEYEFSSDFDNLHKYRTKSLLAIPLRRGKHETIGVLELINCVNENGEIIDFPKRYENLALSLGSQAAVAIDNSRLAEKLKKSYLDTTFRLSTAAEYRDKETSQHIKRMSHYTKTLARKYGLSDDQVDLIFYASPMHDIGKIGIPDSILLKPGKLTPDERKIMETHTIIGGRILDNPESELITMSREIALTHHEKWDGTGYPNALCGGEIPISGRITALADVFDAMSSKRCYKEAFSDEFVLPEIKTSSGKHFEPKMVELFFDCWEEIKLVREEYKDKE
jgi:putative two-component system response regulator